MTANLPLAGHIDHLIALTNVVMDSVDEKGQTNHATSDMATYDYHVQNGVTNEIITLSGNARAETAQVILWGEPIKYDRITGSLTAVNEHTIFKQSLASAHANTNQPGVTSNSPPATIQTTNLPAAKTYLSPATTIQSLQPGTNVPAAKTNFPPTTAPANNPPVINLPIAKTNLSPAKIQSVSPKAPRQM